MKNSLKVGLLAGLAMLLANQAHAQPFNDPPPPGAILDLDGTPIPTSYTQYTTPTFMATSTTTNISFALRDDPAFIFLDDVTMTNVTASAPVPVVNGGFESGIVGDNAPVGWTYLNSFGAAFAGVVADDGFAHTGSNYYFDGAVQAYDGITQAITTIPGDLYSVSFWIFEDSGQATFSRLSTNGDITDTGGNGIDLLFYGGAIPTVPEPGSMVLLGTGLAFVGVIYRKRKLA